MSYEEKHLLHAIELAEQGLGRTFPNPIVGAVIVNRDGVVIGEGFHEGKEHAEILAIKDAQSKGQVLQGAILYCSLEPCNHYGKTPPCSAAIIDAGITEVYFALSDPNPIAAGGAPALRIAGIKVEGDLLVADVSYSNRAWLTKVTLGRPHITAKIAQTLDGRVAAKDGESKWITNEHSRAHAKGLREQFDAICIGTGTAIADNPTLRGAKRNPSRFVIGERDLPVLALDQDEGFEQLKTHDFAQILKVFEERGFNSVLIEGGPTLISAALKSGLVDEIHLYQSGSIMGSGTSSIDIPEYTSFSQQLHYEITALSIIEGDIFAIYFKKDVY